MSTTPNQPGRTPGSRLSRGTPVPPSRKPTAPSAPKEDTAAPEGHVNPQHRSTRTAALVEEFEKTGGKDNTFMILMIVCGVLVFGGGITAWISYSGKAEREQVGIDLTNAADKALADTRDAAAKLVETEDYEGYARQVDVVIKMCDEKRIIIQQDGYDVKHKKDLRMRLDGLKTDLIGRKETALGKKKSLDLLKEVETSVESAEKIGSVALKLPDLRVAANSMGQDFTARVMAISNKLESNKLKFAVEKARADAGTTSDLENKLRAYEPCMDLFRDYFKKVTKAEKEAVDLYKAANTEWDDIVMKLETPEYEAGTPVRDMLAAKERQPGGAWGGTEGVKGEWSGRELVISGVSAVDKDGKERKLRGVYSIDGWSQKWTDVVMEIEFTIVAGEFDMMLRYRPDGYKPYTATYKAGEGGFNANEAYRMTVRIKGSQVEFEQPDQPKNGDSLQLSVSRNGGFGFAVPKGSKIVISRCDMRVLRPRGGVR